MTIDNMLKLILNVKFIKIISLNFDKPSASLFIRVDITKGKRSCCPNCKRKCSGYDSTTQRRKWRALDFGSCKCLLYLMITAFCVSNMVSSLKLYLGQSIIVISQRILRSRSPIFRCIRTKLRYQKSCLSHGIPLVQF